MNTVGRGGALLRPLGSRRFAQHTVGADAHVGPAECTDFTGISGEVVTSQRADVGIGPYNPVNRIATEIEAAFISSEKPYDSKNAAAVKMTDS